MDNTVCTARFEAYLDMRSIFPGRLWKLGKCGVYSLVASQLTSTDIFARMTGAEIDEFFDRDGDSVKVKSWIKEGIEWNVGDVGEPEILDTLGPHDIVVANNFLCHMDDLMAESCLRNIARLVSPHGYLFVSGIDLDSPEQGRR